VDPLIVLFGLGVGILVGTTGMGGGSLLEAQQRPTPVFATPEAS
jgi:hypothetical protein